MTTTKSTTEETNPQVAQTLPQETRDGSRFDRLRGLVASIRVRLLVRYVLLLGLALMAAVFVIRGVLLARMEERIDEALVQEVEEFRTYVEGVDPRTGQPYGGRIRAIFKDFLSSDVPQRGETALAFVNGEPFLRSPGVMPYRLDRDVDLVARWSDLEDPDRGWVNTPAGIFDYAAVPVRGSGGSSGTFVAAKFRDVERREVDQVVRGAAGIGLIALIIGSMLAWRVTHRVLKPVSAVTATAQLISETDLTKRIPLEGRDEISHLARTFNEMLDRLEWAFTAQRAFVNDAGHELRTPITIIGGHLQVLDDDPVQRPATLALITDELGRMARMVEDLLVLAKTEQPDFLRFELIDVETLTQELHSKMSALDDKNWELERSGPGTIEGDRHRLTQAIMQLAENAVHHAPEGETIRFGSEIKDGSVHFWVADQGPGIRQEDRERIFARFARAPGPRRSEGSGLGLSITKAIVEAHHGKLTVVSEPDEGAIFTIIIPVDQARDARRPRQ